MVRALRPVWFVIVICRGTALVGVMRR